VFERFTDGARETLVNTQEEALALGAAAIGPEHLLLGLLRDPEGEAAQILGACGVELSAARSAARHLGSSGSSGYKGMPFTPLAKAALQRSVASAPRLGYPDIRTEHLLAGVLGESGGPADELLLALGVEPHRVRRELTDRVPMPPPVPGRVPRLRLRYRRGTRS